MSTLKKEYVYALIALAVAIVLAYVLLSLAHEDAKGQMMRRHLQDFREKVQQDYK